ncbi:unnamed protein product [Adineta steineri]|uniref:Cytochrome P450 n=1 Tax=Adineta steineri TaxID=433720 RepID=A0A819NUM2_9BILA|nr:unnamed protein product [Adineta steineri]
MVSLTVFLFVFLLILIGLLCYFVHCRRVYFIRRNIPTPPISSLLFGHLTTLWSATSYSSQLYQWTQELNAPTYGLFEGTCPVYVSSNLEFLQEVFVKQFIKFNSRRKTFFAHLAGEERAHLVIAEADQWKRQRTIISPTFSAIKMRPLVPKMEECATVLIEQLDIIGKDVPIDMCEMYKRFSMDVICRCAFGIDDTDVQKNPDNIYLEKTTELFATDAELRPLAKINRILPQLGSLLTHFFYLLRWFNLSKTPANLWLVENIGQLVYARLQSINDKKSKRHVDLMQLMIEAAQSETQDLSANELLSNVMAVLTAGHETTSFALGTCTYVLATRPDIQEKVFSELHEQSNSLDSMANYDTLISKLPYMDIFIREVLRMYPISIQIINRECMEDTEVCGHKITKGTRVQVDVLSVHNNPDYWGPQPVDEFWPERHLTKRHPLAYMPFGIGPRICVGARLALCNGNQIVSRKIAARI